MKSNVNTNKDAGNANTNGEALPEKQDLRNVPLSSLVESQTNPRKAFDADGLKGLIESVREKGVLVPLLVRPCEDDAGTEGYEIVAGARRYRAAKAAKLAEVPCIVRDLNDQQALEVQVIENLQRTDVSELEEADGYQLLMDRGAYDVQALAKKVGKSKEYIYGRLKLRELSAPAKKQLAAGKITAGHAVVLARQREEVQLELLDQVTDKYNPLNVQQLEDEVARRKRQAKYEEENKPKPLTDKQKKAAEKQRKKQAALEAKYKRDGEARAKREKIDTEVRRNLFALTIQRAAKGGATREEWRQMAEDALDQAYVDADLMAIALGVKKNTQAGIDAHVAKCSPAEAELVMLASTMGGSLDYGGKAFAKFADARVSKAEQKKIRAQVEETLFPKPVKKAEPAAGSAFAKKFNEKKKAIKAKPVKKGRRK
jgi:ParB family chromosome partitioning protein